jgi:DNA mismatch repair protein MutL
MAQIHVLDTHVRNRIAAGEVIERPASIVKELVENSIDAGASKIVIETVNGGIESIRVTDNGEGIEPGEIEKALQRHATSKIKTSDDLENIGTLGFRGEALPSIASVTRFSLSSRQKGEASGSVVSCEGDGPVTLSETGMAEGTVVTADAVFFNVPARRKFLKSPATELKHISRTVFNISLPYPEIHFTLRNNRTEVLDFSSCDDTRDRLVQAFGRKTGEQLLSGEYSQNGYTLALYGVKPAVTRGDSKSIYSYVNKRYFRGKEVIHAVR